MVVGLELLVTVTNIVTSSDGWVDTLTIMFGDGACPNASHAGVTDDALVSSCIVGDGVVGEHDVYMFSATQGSTDRNNAPKAVLDAVLESVSPSAGSLKGGTLVSSSAMVGLPCDQIMIGGSPSIILQMGVSVMTMSSNSLSHVVHFEPQREREHKRICERDMESLANQ